MAHRRSGAQRRTAQKARLIEEAQQPMQQVQQDSEKRANAFRSLRGSKAPLLKPVLHAVLAAVESLYNDEMKPFGRLLRKRIAESLAPSAAASEKVPDIDMQHVRAVCEDSDELVVAPEDGGEWSVSLVNVPPAFVDYYSAEDKYPAELWAKAAAYFVDAPDEEMTLPGGRYSCAQALQSRCLPCFEGYSLGQLSHVVQLAIADKKLLGYHNGFVVPYGRSQTMLKEQSAGQQQALANPCLEAASLPCATLQQAKACLGAILADAASSQEEGPGQVALSNVKRMFREQFELELSETTLGHSKLTELLQDCRFRDICYVQLEKHGYTVVQQQPPSTTLQTASFCLDEPLCLSDAEQFGETLMFGPTPGPFGPTPMRASSVFASSRSLCVEEVVISDDPLAPALFGLAQPVVNNMTTHEDGGYLKQLLQDYLGQAQSAIHEADTNPGRFCLNEPLCLEAAEQTSLAPAFGPTPGPFGWSPSPQRARPWVAPTLPSLSPWQDGQIDGMVQRTLIHSQVLVTPLPGKHRRSSSMSDMSESTCARSASCESIATNSDSLNSPSRPAVACGSIPPTPMFCVPPTPLTPPGLEGFAPPFFPPYSMPVLRLVDHLK